MRQPVGDTSVAGGRSRVHASGRDATMVPSGATGSPRARPRLGARTRRALRCHRSSDPGVSDEVAEIFGQVVPLCDRDNAVAAIMESAVTAMPNGTGGDFALGPAHDGRVPDGQVVHSCDQVELVTAFAAGREAEVGVLGRQPNPAALHADYSPVATLRESHDRVAGT